MAGILTREAGPPPRGVEVTENSDGSSMAREYVVLNVKPVLSRYSLPVRFHPSAEMHDRTVARISADDLPSMARISEPGGSPARDRSRSTKSLPSIATTCIGKTRARSTQAACASRGIEIPVWPQRMPATAGASTLRKSRASIPSERREEREASRAANSSRFPQGKGCCIITAFSSCARSSRTSASRCASAIEPHAARVRTATAAATKSARRFMSASE